MPGPDEVDRASEAVSQLRARRAAATSRKSVPGGGVECEYHASSVIMTPTALRRLFRFLDPDNSGVISREEFFRGLEIMGFINKESDRDNAVAILKEIDTDASGDVSGEHAVN